MTSVSLDRVWLNAAADLSDSISFYTADRDDTREVPGSIRTYAGGRTRLITRPGDSRVLPMRAVDVTTAQVAWLDAHRGQIVLFRDKKGRRVWGVYLQVREVDRRAQTGQDVILTVTQVSHTEEV